MSQRTIILLLAGAVLLLLGLLVGQNLERGRSEPRPASPPIGSGSTAIAAPVKPPSPPLSVTEYWITPPAVDATRTGVSSWAVLRARGNFVVDTCRGPDYTLPADLTVALVMPGARCDVLVDGKITRLGQYDFVVEHDRGPPMSFRYTLLREQGIEKLVLENDRLGTVALVPGAKNDLFDRLHRLPADDAARAKFLERMYKQPATR